MTLLSQTDETDPLKALMAIPANISITVTRESEYPFTFWTYPRRAELEPFFRKHQL